MSDGPRGFGFPIDPDDLGRAIEELEKVNAKNRDAKDMEADGVKLRVRRFLEGLNDEQAEDFAWLAGFLAADGKHNYFTSMIYGLAIAQVWQRTPLEEELSK